VYGYGAVVRDIMSTKICFETWKEALIRILGKWYDYLCHSAAVVYT